MLFAAWFAMTIHITIAPDMDAAHIDVVNKTAAAAGLTPEAVTALAFSRPGPPRHAEWTDLIAAQLWSPSKRHLLIAAHSACHCALMAVERLINQEHVAGLLFIDPIWVADASAAPERSPTTTLTNQVLHSSQIVRTTAAAGHRAAEDQWWQTCGIPNITVTASHTVADHMMSWLSSRGLGPHR